MSLLQDYNNKVISNVLKHDAVQQQTIQTLQGFADEITLFFGSSYRHIKRKTPPHSMYLYGSVGRGKTMMMDMLYSQVDIRKQRWHFGAFMCWLHEQLHILQGKKNPLMRIATQLARTTDLLCLDELQVTDITDAMLLGSFFDTLLDCGVVMCTTSNTAPSALYADGLQRERFMPVIHRITRDFVIIDLQKGEDYRLSQKTQNKAISIPASEHANERIVRVFSRLQNTTDSLPLPHTGVVVGDRVIPVVGMYAQASAIIFDFASLCDAPLHTKDYLRIAKQWSIIAIVSIPMLDDNRLDRVRRFIHLIDQLYEFECSLVCSAKYPVDTFDAMYQGTKLRAMFARTASRMYSLLNNVVHAEVNTIVCTQLCNAQSKHALS